MACSTGGTGFVGSVILEQLIRLAPTITRIYVLVREKRGVKGCCLRELVSFTDQIPNKSAACCD